jgi:ribonuclease HI
MKISEPNKKNDEIVIFTDGASSGNPGPGGGAEKNTTNNRMELTAAIEALKFSYDLSSEIRTRVINTDSSYLINGITKWIFSWEKRNWITKNKEPVMNKDLWEKLLDLVKLRNIEWRYVSGHSGILGNERADEIATTFAGGKKPKLLRGKRRPRDLIPPDEFSKKHKSKGRAYSYVSMVDGIILTHKTWAECEKIVKGQSGAKFKKTLSAREEEKILKDWRRHL